MKGLTRIVLEVIFLLSSILSVTHAQEIEAKEPTKSDSYCLFFYKGSDGKRKPVHTIFEWKQKRLQILDRMQMVMGKLPNRSDLPDFEMQVSDSLKGDNYIRLTITFTVAENERVSAYLYIPSPKKTHEKLPAMLVLHETGDLGKQMVDEGSLHPIAKELVQRNYIVMAPDYPGFGDLKNYDFDNDRYESGTMKGIFNHMRCIDLLQSMNEVDPERIGVIGHSLGGHNSMFVGAFDKRIKVIVSSCGWTLFDYYNTGKENSEKYGGRLGPWAQKRYMPLLRDKYKLDEAKIPFDFQDVISVIAPRPFFSNSPLYDSNFDVKGVKKGITEASGVYHFFKADANLQVRYPDVKHSFPPAVRQEAYRFIDKIFKYAPWVDEIK